MSAGMFRGTSNSVGWLDAITFDLLDLPVTTKKGPETRRSRVGNCGRSVLPGMLAQKEGGKKSKASEVWQECGGCWHVRQKDVTRFGWRWRFAANGESDEAETIQGNWTAEEN
jgi:hypothetical protein